MDYPVSCNHLVKIVKVYMLPFCGEIKMNKGLEYFLKFLQITFCRAGIIWNVLVDNIR